MRKAFYTRLIIGLAMPAALVVRFAVWPLSKASAQHAVVFGDKVFINPLPKELQNITFNGDHPGSTIIKKAVASETSDLIWSGAIPMASHGGSTAENVALAADCIDMTTVHPNEIFSFNDVVGARTEEKGYKAGPMYASGEKIMGVGGGICMVATILYHAALESGMKIIERHPHSGPITYAQPGRDAAVSFGLSDLKFKNDTGNSILIHAKVADGKLCLELYGKKKPGRVVKIVSKDLEAIPYKIFEKEDQSIPDGEVKVKQKARPGFSVTTIRLIKQGGVQVSREIVSHDVILPANKIVLIHPKPKDAGEQPAESPAISGLSNLNIHPSPSISGANQTSEPSGGLKPSRQSEPVAP